MDIVFFSPVTLITTLKKFPYSTDLFHLPVMNVARRDFTKLLPELTAQGTLDHIRRESE